MVLTSKSKVYLKIIFLIYLQGCRKTLTSKYIPENYIFTFSIFLKNKNVFDKNTYFFYDLKGKIYKNVTKL